MLVNVLCVKIKIIVAQHASGTPMQAPFCLSFFLFLFLFSSLFLFFLLIKIENAPPPARNRCQVCRSLFDAFALLPRY